MYIEGKYWHNYIGDTDDSLTLLDYLAALQQPEVAVGRVLADFGLDKLAGDFRGSGEPLVYETPEGWEMEILYAIDLLVDLAALLLECRVSGSIDLPELSGEQAAEPRLVLTATEAEHELLNRVLADFSAEPMAYALSELCPEEDMLALAALCQELRRELYERQPE